ncbi:MAG TPA: transketolase C-terminal domain-containing protein [Acidobacteriaceae bacterium]
MTILESLNAALLSLLEEMPEVVLFGEDLLDPYGGAFKVTRGLQAKFPNRVLTTPISEAALAGLANGMALRGLRPVLEIMFGDFLSLCMDQILNHGSKFRTMYNDSVTVPVTIRTPVGGGRGYGPTHSQSIEKHFMGIPEIRIVAPSVFCQAGEVLEQAVRDERLVLFLEHKLLYTLQLFPESAGISCETVLDDRGYPAALLRNYDAGTPDVTLLAYGGMSRLLAPFLQRMAEEEIRILACIPTLIKPLPFEVLCRAASESGRVVVAEEGGLSWGWGAEIAARLHKTLFKELRAPVTRVGAADLAIPSARALERAVLPDEAAMESAVVEVLQ